MSWPRLPQVKMWRTPQRWTSVWTYDRRQTAGRAVFELSSFAQGALNGVLSGCDVVIHLAADGRPGADFLTEVAPSNIQESLGS